jgi:5-methylcytosine-specific restriction protein A
MYQTVIDIDEIRQCQEELQSTLFENLTEKGEYNIGFPGGSWKENICFNNNIWYLSYEIGSEEKSPRFWNGFGLSGDLNDKKSNNIVVEINIPSTGINRRVSGFFAKDPSGNTCLFHRGGLGGGRKGIGKEAFINWSSYSLTSVKTESIPESALLVGVVNSETFTDDLNRFLIEISQFKLFATSGEVSDASYLSNDELLDKIDNEEPTLKKPKKIESSVSNYERSPYIKEYALRKANGFCQLCLKISPFKNKYGQYFLEVHHIEWLSKGGQDTKNNVVALCPNCHRKMHIVNRQTDRKSLHDRAINQKLP